MRAIALSASEAAPGDDNGKPTPNPALTVYDTSGPYTDPTVAIDLRKGLPPLRLEWIKSRGDVQSYPARRVRPEDNGLESDAHTLDIEGFPVSSRRAPLRARPGMSVTQLHYARRGDRKSTRLNSSHIQKSRMPSSA